jgi:hypothetical protein
MKAKTWIALALLTLALLPAAALGAKPTPAWPTAQDVQKGEPGLLAKDAACIARYYRGRLSRKLWLTQYYDLTAAQKATTDAGPEHCMTLAQRTATDARLFAVIAGKHPQVHCVAVRAEALTPAQRAAQTNRATWLRAYDGMFRACGLTGALYSTVAQGAHLTLTVAEQACANRTGSVDPVLSGGPSPSKANMRAIGSVLDRCVGAASKRAMYRYLVRAVPVASAIPCIAKTVASKLTFAELLTKDPVVKTTVQSATAACLTQPNVS